LGQAAYNAANELTSWDGLVPTYDAEGEMTTDANGNQYTWNARNQLIAISGANSASFEYDAFGRRITKAAGAASISFQYDGLNRVAETSGGATTWLLPGALDEYFQRTDTTGSTVPLTDALGSTIGMTDSSGALATSYWYDPFGTTTVGGAPNGNSTRFAGREDEGNGLYYNRARYYSPEAGRFLSEDPMGFAGNGPNLYEYVGDSPTNEIDPSGEVPLHGNWCGPNWTGGRVEPYDPNHDNDVISVGVSQSWQVGIIRTPYYLPPVDALDAACENHDKCDASCRADNKCDKKARRDCMNQCNQALAAGAANSGVWSIWTPLIAGDMQLPPPDYIAGPNDSSCRCSKE
jgi:RHS repeat-associated protein